jgi:cobaltochelatase CobN
LQCGKIAIGVQPARGYKMDAKAIHHDPELAPPHGYLAFYIWLRQKACIHAAVHMGKHGNLEWLPGKALALSNACYPEILLGPLPHIYPFIANDPGEGTQAKRRTSAVIISHLTPPLTRADTYGPLKDLEALVDEYYEASGVDPRRLKLLGARILDKTRDLGLDRDCGIKGDATENEQLQQLDNYLCELKEMQIRDGLHVFGQSPEGEQLDNLALALLRIPRKQGKGEDASLIRALAGDLELGDFDPLDCDYAAPWNGPRPAALAGISNQTWRITGDTVERLESLALELVSTRKPAPETWMQSRTVLAGLQSTVRPRIMACGAREIKGALDALAGKFIPPGPSGAPTRGRLDVLPTGRNFYSVDTRTVPTKTAWELGQLSADRLITAYFQEHGDWPRQMGISAWGTSNMRTGGDDIAQALALIGARPQWDPASRRVTGFEIIPLSELKRPRVDVLFRISGFFRDAFPAKIELLDSAIQAVAALDESIEANPLAKSAEPRIFGARPGRYGAGLQDMLETGLWTDRAELAKSYIRQAAYAYGAGSDGNADEPRLKTLLKSLDAVVQNQDAREFDLLDSDDFHDFEGGMAVAAEHLGGKRPVIYHNDHSNPQNPKIRTLEQEISLIVRGRAANPKWISGQMRHGYKGAADMAQTVSNLFAFAATTGAVSGHHFEMLFEAYLIDPQTHAFLERANPAALRDMAAKFMDAASRDLWRPRRNSALDYLTELAKQDNKE